MGEKASSIPDPARRPRPDVYYLSALAALATLRKLLPGAATKALPSPKDDPALATKKGEHRNGCDADPPAGHHRLTGLFEEVFGGDQEAQKRACCAAAVGD